MHYISYANTNQGINKENNQDSLCIKVANTKHYGQVAMLVLCDGMGGLSKGELASATVVQCFSNWFIHELPKKIKNYSWNNLSLEWNYLIQEQNNKILEYGQKMGIHIGTTLSAILILEEKYMIAHVGDSRIYRIFHSVEQLTEDQTVVEREVKRGKMTLEQADKESHRHMLWQCIGASETVIPQIIFGRVRPNTVYMVCSDGFYQKITYTELLSYFCSLKSIQKMKEQSEAGIQLVKNRGEKDDISVALIQCLK